MMVLKKALSILGVVGLFSVGTNAEVVVGKNPEKVIHKTPKVSLNTKGVIMPYYHGGNLSPIHFQHHIAQHPPLPHYNYGSPNHGNGIIYHPLPYFPGNHNNGQTPPHPSFNLYNFFHR
jgi:hypothetical protein